MPIDLLTHRVDKIENRVEKLEDSFKTLSDKSIKHDENITMLANNLKIQTDSLHKLRNIVNVDTKILESKSSDIKNLYIINKEQDNKINDISVNIERLTCISENYVKTGEQLISKINDLAKNNNNKISNKNIYIITGICGAIAGLITAIAKLY